MQTPARHALELPADVPDRRTAEVAFASELQRPFPDPHFSAKRVSLAFAALNDLAAQARGLMVTRSRLLDTLRDVLGVDLVAHRDVLAIHVRSDRDGEAANAIEVDASSFSRGTAGYPDPSRWNAELLGPLGAIALWARQNRFARIALSGSYRLTAGFALGWAFRSAIGFEIAIPTKAAVWATDEHADPRDSALLWSLTLPNELRGGHLVVGVGVLRDPAPAIRKSWSLPDDSALLLATLPQALTSAVEAQYSVRILKTAIADAVARLRPARIDL